MKKRDIILVAVMILISLIAALLKKKKKKGDTVEIYKDNLLYGSYPLESDTIIRIDDPEGYDNVIEISNARVRMAEADCPQRLCVSCGWMDKSGESICCAPSRLLVMIRSEDGGYDAVTK